MTFQTQVPRTPQPLTAMAGLGHQTPLILCSRGELCRCHVERGHCATHGQNAGMLCRHHASLGLHAFKLLAVKRQTRFNAKKRDQTAAITCLLAALHSLASVISARSMAGSGCNLRLPKHCRRSPPQRMITKRSYKEGGLQSDSLPLG